MHVAFLPDRMDPATRVVHHGKGEFGRAREREGGHLPRSPGVWKQGSSRRGEIKRNVNPVALTPRQWVGGRGLSSEAMDLNRSGADIVRLEREIRAEVEDCRMKPVVLVKEAHLRLDDSCML